MQDNIKNKNDTAVSENKRETIGRKGKIDDNRVAIITLRYVQLSHSL